MKTFVLALCGFLVAFGSQFSAFGQTRSISLDKKILAVNARTVYVTKLVDGRQFKAHIGLVQTGMLNKKTFAILDKNMEEALGGLIARSLPKSPDAKPIVVKVLWLQVSELTNLASEMAKAEVTLEFFYEKDDLYYPLLKTTAVFESKGIEVTHHHADNLTSAISSCFGQLALLDIEEKVRQVSPLGWSEIENSTGPEATEVTEVLRNETPVRGIYNSVYEFMTNTPNDTIPFKIDVKSLTDKKGPGQFEYVPYYVLPDGKKQLIKNVWGFSDGINVLINHRNKYHPLIRKGNDFTFIGTRGPDQQAVAVGTVAGGLLGAAIASAATSGNEVEYVLRLPSGEIVERPHYDRHPVGEQKTSEAATVILYQLPRSKPTPAGDLYVGEELVQTLGLYTVYEMAWEGNSALTICVKGTEETCFTFYPKPGAVQYLEYSTDKGRAQLNPVYTKTGEQNVKRVRHLEEKERKKGNAKL